MFNDGFDNDKYFSLQTDRILKRISQFGGKLYLEFGGKLFDDYHASRVLPGFKPDTKINMLLRLKDKAEIVVVVSAAAIEQNKMRADLGITYDMDALRLIDAFRERSWTVSDGGGGAHQSGRSHRRAGRNYSRAGDLVCDDDAGGDQRSGSRGSGGVFYGHRNCIRCVPVLQGGEFKPDRCAAA